MPFERGIDFLDVALDELWRDMDYLLPILELLPALHIEDKGEPSYVQMSMLF